LSELLRGLKTSLHNASQNGARYFLAFVFAFLAHIFLFALLFFGLQWRQGTVSGVAVELWQADIPQPSRPIVAPVDPPPTSRTAQLPQAADTPSDIALAKTPPKKNTASLAKPEPKTTAPQVPKKVSKPPAASVPPAPKPTPQAQQKKLKDEERARAAQLARLREIFTEAGSGGSQGAASGSAAAGISEYTEKVRQRVQPYIFFSPEDLVGNPSAVVKVNLAADGSLLHSELTKSSGYPNWDAAVLRAIQHASPLPRDTNGQAPPSLTIIFRPHHM
jgi:colicin import membrane protein